MSPHDSNNRTGDSPAGIDLPACFQQHRRWLRNVVAGRLIEKHAVDDVMQEVALAACNGSQSVAESGAIAPWLYRVAVRQSLLYRRKKGRQKKLVDGFASRGNPPSTSRENDPLNWILATERQANIRLAIGRLVTRDREILMLKYTENWSYRQLSEHLGVSVGTVEYRLTQARKQLRRELLAAGLDQGAT
jgi:RNA polymerase sigma factor (sigma-70 family)